MLCQAIDRAVNTKKAVHVLGLLSQAVFIVMKIILLRCWLWQNNAAQKKIYIHAFLDGRDTPPKSAAASLKIFTAAPIASLIGRYYAMDRDKRWDRVQQAYELLVEGKAKFDAPDALTGLERAYQRGETDEFVQATAIHAPAATRVTIQEGDTVIFMNFRADRARELTRAFIEPDFHEFPRHIWPKTHFVSLTEYDTTFKIPAAFPPERLDRILGEYLSELSLRQLRIAETEKYAHVTFFFNGGIETPYKGEDRILISSPSVATYDLNPK